MGAEMHAYILLIKVQYFRMENFIYKSGNLMRAFILVMFFLTGCATTAGYKKVLDSWVGSNVDRLVSSWGVPANSFSLTDGGRVLEYSNRRNVAISGIATTVPQTTYQNGSVNVYGNSGNSTYGNYSGTSTTYVQQPAPVYNVEMQCNTRFTVNAQGIITRWTWQGNDCKAKEPEQLTQKNTEQLDKARAENNEILKNLDLRSEAICVSAEYSMLMQKTPCLGKQISLIHLADSTKVTLEQKELVLKFRSEIDAVSTERNAFMRKVGGVKGNQLSDFLESIQPEIDQYNLDLYKGVITWGEYNQRRKNLYAKIMTENRKIYPSVK